MMSAAQEPRDLSETGRGGEVTRHCRIFSSDVVLAVADNPDPPFDDVARRLREYEKRFSRFIAGNELAQLNGSGGRWVDISADMARLLTHALVVAVESHGLVNIATTVALIDAGYGRSWPQPWQPAAAASPRPVPTLTQVLEVRRREARLQADVTVDFGGVAKGLWADEVVAMLGQNAAASLGGDVSARGDGIAGEGWPISIPNGRTVQLHNGGIATSGISKRRSGTAHHLIDPRTGIPSTSVAKEVAVIAKSATVAEWVATAVLVSGDDQAFLDRTDVLEVMVEPIS